MRIRATMLACLGAGVAIACAAEEGDDKPARGVEKAIKSGVKWLRKNLESEMSGTDKAPKEAQMTGRAQGALFLEALALAHAGVPASDPLIQEAWKRCSADRLTGTYDAALRLLFCEALVSRHVKGGPSPAAVKGWMREAAGRLAAWCNGGIWSYGGGQGFFLGRDRSAKYDAEASGYPEAPKPGMDYRIGGEALKALADQGAGDFSNAQYAVLGLKAAALCGIRPENADLMWRVVADLFINEQEPAGPESRVAIASENENQPIPWLGKAGYKTAFSAKARGWGYVKGVGKLGKTYGSMTSCGLGALLVARSEIRDLSGADCEKIDGAIRDGIAWMATNFSVDKNPFGERCDSFSKAATYYHLYGLERTGMLSNVRKMANHDWYKEGCAFLLKEQKPDGSWPAGEIFETPPARTAFALLFLARATSSRYAAPYQKVDIGEEVRERQEPAPEKRVPDDVEAPGACAPLPMPPPAPSGK